MKIEDYGFLSDTECAALVGKDGSIDWFCAPRFDSPASFAKLLGTEENGYWKIAPEGDHKFSGRRYRDGSLILETDMATDAGRVRITDCMPVRDQQPTIVRVVEGLEGRVAMTMKLVIRFDYGEAVPWVRHCEGGLTAVAGPDALTLRGDVEMKGVNLSTMAHFEVEAGTRISFVLTWHPSHEKPSKPISCEGLIASTEKFWLDWSGRCKARGEWADEQKSSLVVLKGLTYAPTGGVLAAATTSLPEYVGGVRNWDYRYCWVRDATFTLYALLTSGFIEEAKAWRDWLLRAVAGSPDQMRIMYGVAGERRLDEFELPHLAGYEGSVPVRVGNAASKQFQLDVYGELMDALHQARRTGVPADEDSWSLEKHLLNHVMEHWQEPDEGIWEVRGPRRNFTHSKVMAWVAVDRAVKAVENFGLKGDAEKWRRVRDEIHREICARGFNAEKGTFTQSFGSSELDASLLMIPLVGFLPAGDPRVRGTIEAISRELVVDGFVMRYHPSGAGSVDGLPPGEGAFLPCSFWLADCLHLTGRSDEARELFQRLMGLRNDLGLLAEEYDSVQGRMLGNFPQAFSHVAWLTQQAI